MLTQIKLKPLVLGILLIIASIKAKSQYPIDGRLNLFILNLATNENRPVKVDTPLKTLRLKKVVWKNDQRIEEVLLNERIYTNDKDIYKLLYEINPSINALDSIKAGTKINIPVIDFAKDPLMNGEYYIVHLDESSRQKFIEIHNLIENQLPKDSLRFQSKFSSQKDYRRADSSLIKLKQLRLAIQERTKVIPYSVLLNLIGLSNSFQNILLLEKIPPSQSNNLDGILSNLIEFSKRIFDKKSGNYIPPNFMTKVTVSVLDKNQKKLNGYTIYYSSPGLEGMDAYSIPFRNSEADYVSEAKWSFWATKGPGIFPSQTEIKKIEIRNYITNLIELRIK